MATGNWHTSPLSADQATLLGELAERLDRAGRRLLLDDVYTPEWLLSDITFSCDPTPFNDWYLGHEWTWFADVSGRYLNALVSFTPHAGEMPQRGRELVEKILESQSADGHFGPDRSADTCDRSQASGTAWMLLALPRYFALTGDERALEAAKQLAAWYADATPHWLDPAVHNAQTTLGSYALTFSNFTHCLDGLAALWKVDPQDRWLDLARTVADAVKPYEVEIHSHHFLSTLRGMLDWHEMTGDACFLDKVVTAQKEIVQHGMLDTWGVPEAFNRPHTDEGCSEVDWVLVNLKLFACTGRPEYLDVAERCLYSHFFMNQTPFGGFGTWHGFHTAPSPMPEGTVGRYKEAYWCCSMHGVYGLAEIARHVYTLSPDGGVSVNLLVGCEGTVPTANGPVTITQTGAGYPWPGTATLVVAAPEGARVPISVQLPRHSPLVQVRLNGSPVDQTPSTGSTLELTLPGGEQRLELEFRMSVRSEPSRHPDLFKDRKSLWYGPMALGTNAYTKHISYSIDDGVLADLAPIPPWRENGFSSEVQFALPATDAPDYEHTRTRREMRLYPLAACGHRRLSWMMYMF